MAVRLPLPGVPLLLPRLPRSRVPEDKQGMADEDGRARLRAIATEVERAFPLTCRRTLLVLSDLDPDRLQAQWQVEPGLLALAKGGFPADLDGVRPRLRLLRVDAGNQEVAALSLPNDGEGAPGVARFLVSGGPGVRYRAELGLASPEGGWLLLTRSAVASVPPQPREVPAGPAGAEGVGEGALPAAPPGVERSRCGEELPPSEDLTLTDPGVPLAPVFPWPSRWEAIAGPLAPGHAAAAGGRFMRLPAQGITPLVIAREPPPPGPPGDHAPGEWGAGEGPDGSEGWDQAGGAAMIPTWRSEAWRSEAWRSDQGNSRLPNAAHGSPISPSWFVGSATPTSAWTSWVPRSSPAFPPDRSATDPS